MLKFKYSPAITVTIISDEYPRTCIDSATERLLSLAYPVIDNVDNVMFLLIFLFITCCIHVNYYQNWQIGGVEWMLCIT